MRDSQQPATAGHPLTIILHRDHDTHTYIKRPAQVGGNIAAGWQIAKQRSGRRVVGYILSAQRGDECFAVKGFFPTSQAASAAVPEFLKALGVTSAVWLATFAVLAWLFPGVA